MFRQSLVPLRRSFNTCFRKQNLFALTNVANYSQVAGAAQTLIPVSAAHQFFPALQIYMNSLVNIMEWIWEGSTIKKRMAKMNKHTLRKRRKLMRRNTKSSRN